MTTTSSSPVPLDDKTTAAWSGRVGRAWLMERKVDKLLAQLIEAMLCAQPKNPILFLKEWSSALVIPQEGGGCAGGTDCADDELAARRLDTVTVAPSEDVATQPKDEGVVDNLVTRQSSQLLESGTGNPLSCGDTEEATLVMSDRRGGERQDEVLETVATSDIDEPTQSAEGLTNADVVVADDPGDGEARPSIDELRSRFPTPSAAGIRAVSLSPVGRGNYGYVLQGEVTKSNAAATVATLCAVKVVPIRAHWTLDEAKFSVLISDTANRIAAPRASWPSSSLSSSPGLPTRPSDDAAHDAAVLGASHVLRLHGRIAYDEATDALWIPLTWAPTTLADVVAFRKKSLKNNTSPVHSAAKDATAPPYFSWVELRFLMRRILLALHFLTTECGVVHLDVKPSNILFAESGTKAESAAAASGGGGGGGAVQPSSDVSSVNAAVPVDVVSQRLSCCGDLQVLLGDYGLVQPIGSPAAQLGDFLYMAPEIFWVKESDVGNDASQTASLASDGSLGSKHSDSGHGDDAAAEESAALSRSRVSAVDSVSGSDGGQAATLTTKMCAEFFPTHDVWSCGCVLLYLVEGDQPFLWEDRKFFSALEENYLVPMTKNTSRWRGSEEGRQLLDFLLACFERDYDVRPTAWQLLQHPFLVSA